MSNTTQPFFTPGNAANPTSSKPTLGNAGKGIRMSATSANLVTT